MLASKVDFRRKDFVPYSETLRLRKEQAEKEAQMPSATDAIPAPPLTSSPETSLESSPELATLEAPEDSDIVSSAVNNDSSS